MKVDWSIVNISLLIAVLLLLSAAGWILRRMNCED
jgi:flagellar biogenesis protein FliO